MSRLYAYVRVLPKFTPLFERKLCVLSVVNYQVITDRNFLSYITLHNYKWNIRDPFIVTVRSFAKNKGKLKKGVPRIPINDQELSEVFDVEKLYSEFKQPVDNLKKIYVEQLGLRTSASSVQDIKVRYDGNVYTVQDLAEIKRKNSKELVLEMGCFVDAIPSVMDSIRNSALNVNPSQEGSAIIIPILKVTQEYRESLAKNAKASFNKCKEIITDVQNRNIKLINNKERLSEDVIFRLKAQVTAIGEKHVIQAEEIYKTKEKELLSSD